MQSRQALRLGSGLGTRCRARLGLYVDLSESKEISTGVLTGFWVCGIIRPCRMSRKTWIRNQRTDARRAHGTNRKNS